MRQLIALALLVLLVSCKSKAVVAEAGTNKKLAAEKIIEGYYANKKEFSTLYIKANAHYEDAKQSQNVTAEVKIKKDEMILISIRFLGITMAKAMITPTEVKYYEKINGEYFEGDYSTLSKWLGTDLDFQKMQNMLIGQALDDLHKGKYTETIDEKMYKLETADDNTIKSFFFEAAKFMVKTEQIEQKNQKRLLRINYPDYTETAGIFLPTGLNIEASQENKKTTINIQYNSASFNEDLTFPYSVPEGYERIYIN